MVKAKELREGDTILWNGCRAVVHSVTEDDVGYDFVLKVQGATGKEFVHYCWMLGTDEVILISHADPTHP